MCIRDRLRFVEQLSPDEVSTLRQVLDASAPGGASPGTGQSE